MGRGERLLFMDADGATRVSDLEKLEAALAGIMASQGERPSYVTGSTSNVDVAGLHASS